MKPRLQAPQSPALPALHSAMLLRPGPAPPKPAPALAPRPPRAQPPSFPQNAKAASSVLCAFELANGYGACGPAEFRAAHGREAAAVCAAAAEVVTGVSALDGSWAGAAPPNKTSDRAPGVMNKLDNPFESPYHNPHDNPNWSGWGSPYGSPYNPSPWSRPSGGYGGGYNPYIPYNPYTNNPGGYNNGGYTNGQVYQFYGRWYRYDNGRWTQVEAPSGGSSTPAAGQQYVNNQWYQIDGQWCVAGPVLGAAQGCGAASRAHGARSPRMQRPASQPVGPLPPPPPPSPPPPPRPARPHLRPSVSSLALS
jgi:hypothetical protein